MKLSVELGDFEIARKGAIDDDMVRTREDIFKRGPVVGSAEDRVDDLVQCEYPHPITGVIEDHGNALVVAPELFEDLQDGAIFGDEPGRTGVVTHFFFF